MATTATTTTYQYPYPLGGDSLSNVATRIKELADRSETITAQIIAGNITLAPGTIYNANIAATAGIAYSKLALTGAILNTDLAGSISPSKITGTAITAADTGTVTGTIIASNVALGGNPTTTTVTGTTDNTTKIATTGFVQQVATALAVGSIPDGSLTNVKINSAAAIAYSKLNLATSILNADVSASAAIAYSKLNLATSIVNADVSASAAIVSSKLDLTGYTGHTVVANTSARPASPIAGQMIYQTDSDELLKYVTDLDGIARWMIADHDFRRNMVINGAFDVWQRGTSFNPVSATSTTGLNYGADRWQFLQATSNPGTFSQQAITSTDPAGYNYYLRVQRTAAQTFTTAYTVQTSFESRNIQAVRGRFVTLSFWARAGANYSNATSYLVSNIVTGTGTDNTTGNFTGNTVNTTTNNVLTTSWKRFVVTTSAALATTITQLGVSFVFTPVGTAGTNDYFDITGVQLEVGSAPSDFEFRDAGEELRRCQRYYYQMGPWSPADYQTFGVGFIIAPSSARTQTSFPVSMRTAPTDIRQTGTAANYAVSNLNTLTACTSVPAFLRATTDGATTSFSTLGTMTAGQGCLGINNITSTAYLGWSAEL
jgi:hypothetical protein